MPFQVRIHSGTVNIVACDIDGYANPAVQALGDTQACTVTIIDSVLGGNRYDTNGTRLSSGTSVVQASKAKQAAPDLATLTLTRVLVDPAVETSGGISVRVGSTVADQLTETAIAFTTGLGAPHTAYFEDYPTINPTSGLASPEAFTAGTVKLSTTLTHSSLASSQAFDVAQVKHLLKLAASSLASDEAFDAGGLYTLGRIFHASLASSEAFDAGTIYLNKRLTHASVASSEAFTPARVLFHLVATSLASSEAFDAAAIKLRTILVAAAGIASGQAFGVANFATTRFLGHTSLASSEVFGSGNFVISLPGADEAPVEDEPGRVAPSGAQAVGSELVATIGAWEGFPSAARFVWLRDGTPIRDTGYQADTWSDTYILQDADAGHAITVAQYAQNTIAATGPQPATGSVNVHGIAPAFYQHDVVFGPMPTLGDVLAAIQTTLRTWFATYLRERERLTSRGYGALPNLRGWRVFTQSLETELGDQFPCCVLVAPGAADTLRLGAEGYMQGTFEVGISIIVSGRDTGETLTLASEYGAALRACVSQHASFGGVSGATRIIGERYDEIPNDDQRTISAVQLVCSLRVDNLANRFAGPTEPFPDPAPTDDPGGPTVGTIETPVLELERV